MKNVFIRKYGICFLFLLNYDATDKATQMFFAATQNKLIYAVTHQTAAELILSRADSSKPNMNLTSWKGKIVRKQDIYTSKNYLTEDELDSLNRIVTIFLESAELRAKMRKDLTMHYWEENVDKLITDHDLPLLEDKGHCSTKQMESKVEEIYLKFDSRRKAYEVAQADHEDESEMRMLEEAEKMLKRR